MSHQSFSVASSPILKLLANKEFIEQSKSFKDVFDSSAHLHCRSSIHHMFTIFIEEGESENERILQTSPSHFNQNAYFDFVMDGSWSTPL